MLKFEDKFEMIVLAVLIIGFSASIGVLINDIIITPEIGAALSVAVAAIIVEIVTLFWCLIVDLANIGEEEEG